MARSCVRESVLRCGVPQVTQRPPVGRDCELAFFGAVVAEYATWLILRPRSGLNDLLHHIDRMNMEMPSSSGMLVSLTRTPSPEQVPVMRVTSRHSVDLRLGGIRSMKVT